MNLRKTGLIIAASLLYGCSDGEGEDGAPSNNVLPPGTYTGTFVDSAVEGLYYETPSRTGLTNHLGQFYFLEGEAVTFKLGDTVLGVVNTKASNNLVVTPFSLYGINPLKTEPEISAALKAPNTSSFDRALNVATLLQSFDLDNDPDNGIDLGNAHDQLANSKIDLYVKATEFDKQASFIRAKQKVPTSNDRNLASAAQHLYKSLQIPIETPNISKASSNDGVTNEPTISYKYDSNGNVTKQSTDINNDGQADSVKDFTYDDNGNLTSISNSAQKTTETLNYDENNNLLSRVVSGEKGDQLYENYTYQGEHLIRVEIDHQADSSIDISTDYTYDRNGNMTQYQTDTDSDGTPNTIGTYTYDSDKVSSYMENRNNSQIPSVVISYGYDENGKRISHSIDITSDGNPNSVSTYEYDKYDNIVLYTLDKDLDGTPDYIESYRHNTEGKRTLYRKDFNADGVWDSISTYDYDSNGNRTRMTEDSNADGTIDKVWSGSYAQALSKNSWENIISGD